jgi:alkanesulfonate monooxygenase
VAKYADACNLFPTSSAELTHKLGVLRQHCDAIGRNYDDIEKTMLGRISPGANGGLATAELIENCKAWAKLGFQHVILSDVPNVQEIKPLEVIGREVIPAVAEL